LKLDKWQIGPLRAINLVAFTIVVYWLRKYLVKLVAIEPFLTLGKASLKVVCAHIFFVFAGLALLYGDLNSDGLDQLHGVPAIALLAVTFTALIVVAANEVRKKRAERERKKAEQQGRPNATGANRGTGGAVAMDAHIEDVPQGMILQPICEPATISELAKTGS
jgi:hypothetical protein